MTHNQRQPTPEEHFGRLVRAARETRGETQESLAGSVRYYLGEGVRFDQSAVARIEAGKRLLRVNEAVILARLLDIDMRDIEVPHLGLDARQINDELDRLRLELPLAEAKDQLAFKELQVAQAQRTVAFNYLQMIKAKIAHFERVSGLDDGQR